MVVNLDDMEYESLRAFFVRYMQNRELLLAEYCLAKGKARKARLAGCITDALRHERICESIYNMLPTDQRW